MDYIEQDKFNQLAQLNSRIWELTEKIKTTVGMKEKLPIIRERTRLIEQRDELLLSN